MSAINKEQIKRLYVLGGSLGMVDRHDPEDMLHTLVCALTGKESIRALSQDEFELVQRDLIDRMRLARQPAVASEPKPGRKQPEAKASAQPGMMTTAQQSLAWRLIYQLAGLDPESTASAGQRMRGAIKRILGTDTEAKNPFRWVTLDQGHTLIESLKRYVRSAQRRAAANDGEGTALRTDAR